MKIKTILVSQPEPKNDKSPYSELAEKNNLKIDFRPFIQVDGVSAKEFRQSRIDILAHTGVIFTSRTAIDHFFRISEEMRLSIPDTMKYFCISEATALYLQKYIVYRKRKIFYGDGKFGDLMGTIKKHKEEKFLVPLSDIHKEEIPKKLEQARIKYTKAIMYRTVSADLSDLSDVNYDMLVFYSPSGIKSLLENFPDFEQNNTQIATFGPKTAKAVKDAGLKVNVKAPTKEAPSMTMAIDQFINNHQKSKK
ncbi:MAG: uroporphyrinogen-III synthase [Bacteroidales bacterium]|jgi:uroporphyrinogen-III synthase|nr:uroporphyrinogen-III synthase [Bacteroidales bacterium]